MHNPPPTTLGPDAAYPALSAAQPCGTSLEYDPEYAVLQARLQPRSDVQYGSFASQPEGPDWSEVERDCRRLLLLSTDISLLIWLTRARTRRSGAAGLALGLDSLHAALRSWPQDVHPQLMLDGLFDPAVRANALAALCDPEGLLGDIRDIVVCASTAARLSMRDIERAHAIPRPPYSPEPQAIHRQLAALHAKKDATLHSLLQAAQSARALAHWIAHDPQSQLGDDAPHLAPLLKVFADLCAFQAQTMDASLETRQEPYLEDIEQDVEEDVEEDTAYLPAISAAMSHDLQHQREHIRSLLLQVQQWIEHNEPSSPVSVLLKQAQRMWGKRFSEVASQIPPDLLQAWDRDVP
ncbi:ImpA family type VI secretion system protein [Rhodoferax aquaticus]|uniref:Type VI secretion system protein TssA n=1 Tax=Rhodoferax aquaticus TaxID=2527691 RepID=A0A515EPX5_9BURK|nr:type VI secretion system ImpA family N-terminal domain-containing protein [Rhodoferax aquaticus]QDL54670.1 type VI secretion system protein TssA [Rhodoferax aquaticus]